MEYFANFIMLFVKLLFTPAPNAPMSSSPRANALCRALADPVRVRILNLLRLRQELSASDVATIFSLQRSDLHRHVKYLERAHLISSRRVGQVRQYRFTDELSPFHEKLINFLSSLEELSEVKQDIEHSGQGD